jgi:hypothetical protein
MQVGRDILPQDLGFRGGDGWEMHRGINVRNRNSNHDVATVADESDNP